MRIRLVSFFVLISAGFAFSCTAAIGDTARIPMVDIAKSLEDCVRGTHAHLNNYAGPSATNHLKPNDSAMTLSACLGGSVIAINIPEVTEAVQPSPAGIRFYVNNIVMQQLKIAPSATGFNIILTGNHTGSEVKGHCYGAACNFMSGAGIGINATDMKIIISVVPQVLGTNISYGNARANVQMNLSVSGFPPALNAAANGAVGQMKNTVTGSIAGTASNAMMQAQPRAAFANWFRGRLNQMGIKQVSAVHVEGTMLVIEHGVIAAIHPIPPAPAPPTPHPTLGAGEWGVFAPMGTVDLTQIGRLIPLPDGSYNVHFDRMPLSTSNIKIRKTQ